MQNCYNRSWPILCHFFCLTFDKVVQITDLKSKWKYKLSFFNNLSGRQT